MNLVNTQLRLAEAGKVIFTSAVTNADEMICPSYAPDPALHDGAEDSVAQAKEKHKTKLWKKTD